MGCGASSGRKYDALAACGEEGRPEASGEGRHTEESTLDQLAILAVKTPCTRCTPAEGGGAACVRPQVQQTVGLLERIADACGRLRTLAYAEATALLSSAGDKKKIQIAQDRGSALGVLAEDAQSQADRLREWLTENDRGGGELDPLQELPSMAAQLLAGLLPLLNSNRSSGNGERDGKSLELVVAKDAAPSEALVILDRAVELLEAGDISSSSAALGIGTPVRVKGLASTPQLNNTIGHFQGWSENGRCLVAVEEGRVLSLKPTNIERVASHN